jgi:hypothetical protein
MPHTLGGEIISMPLSRNCLHEYMEESYGWIGRCLSLWTSSQESQGYPQMGKTREVFGGKTRAKAISDEIKAKYGTERGNRGIRISDINDPATRFATRLLGCKLMHKCAKRKYRLVWSVSLCSVQRGAR